MRRNGITSAVLKPGAVRCDRCDFRYSALVRATIEASCAGPLGFTGSLTFLLFAVGSRGGVRCVNGTLANRRTWAGSSSDTKSESDLCGEDSTIESSRGSGSGTGGGVLATTLPSSSGSGRGSGSGLLEGEGITLGASRGAGSATISWDGMTGEGERDP